MEVTIQFLLDQIKHTKFKILLAKRQISGLEEHKKDRKGFTVELSFNQLRENQMLNY